MREICEINETLLKIRAGKFVEPEGLEQYDFNTFQAMDEVEDFFDDYTYQIPEKVKGVKGKH